MLRFRHLIYYVIISIDLQSYFAEKARDQFFVKLKYLWLNPFHMFYSKIDFFFLLFVHVLQKL